ncbi:MAG: undecaprenyl-diphosphatase UppP [Calditrichaeota bacterium]|nr:MAG: undecaprenyl-diphosphatase UppP [Calditrichota bacterium]
MEFLKALILGMVQGLTEFLPVSSSGHLVIFQKLLGFQQQGIAFDVFVHLGTLLAVLVVFRQDILRILRTLPGLPSFIASGFQVKSEDDQYRAITVFIIIASIPTGIIGLSLESKVELLFKSLLVVSLALIVTGLIMWTSRFAREREPFMNGAQAFLIGFAQAFAIIPGISRSGSTIVSAMWLGLNRELAARFSFLLSIPVIFFAALQQTGQLLQAPPSTRELFELAVGTLSAAVFGYLAIIWLLKIVQRRRLDLFAYYCFAVGGAGLLISLFT